jgi:hypothetical protein
VIELNKLTDGSYRVSEYCKWIDQATTHAELDTIRGVLTAHRQDIGLEEEKRLTADEYREIAEHGKERREELNQ